MSMKGISLSAQKSLIISLYFWIYSFLYTAFCSQKSGFVRASSTGVRPMKATSCEYCLAISQVSQIFWAKVSWSVSYLFSAG